MPAAPMPTASPLAKKINQVVLLRTAERDIYPYIRDLLTDPRFGINLAVDQVVIDTPIPGLRDAPDLAVYLRGLRGEEVLRSPDHAVGVIEVKPEHPLAKHEEAIREEKAKYVQTGTKVFYLIDQERVIRYDVPAFLNRHEWMWEALKQPEVFQECFEPLSANRANLDAVLREFRAAGSPFSYLEVNAESRYRFIETVRQAVNLIIAAVGRAVENRLKPDLVAAVAEVARLEADWGEASYTFAEDALRIDFARAAEADFTDEQGRRYEAAVSDLMARIQGRLYALRVEKKLLPGYAVRMGMEENPSLLAPPRSGQKLTPDGKAVENFIYETASLILSRMLMIRFSEDNGFLARMISNGGVSAFAGYAQYFQLGMQSLIRETYRKARDLYTGLFSPTPLDWIVDYDDTEISNAILHAMFLLNRWDFATISGDILSGVYDQYLDPSRRRLLGEVFTRPEVAQYVLDACGDTLDKTLLDPACGSGTFLVERLNRTIARLKQAGIFTLDSAVAALQGVNGLDINPFSASLAQMQVLWHLLELFRGLPPAEIPVAARRLISGIRIEGGHTSLETFGYRATATNGGGWQAQGRLDFNETQTMGGAFTSVSRRFRAIATGQYDVVVGNPPYVRAHRLAMPPQLREDFEEVMRGQSDLYIPFVYKAMTSWVKEGGRMGFIVPITVLTTDYGAPLRQALLRYKLLEIVDFEALRKTTFRGIKRPTVALIIENAPGSPDDPVTITTPGIGCYDRTNDRIDMERAHKSVVTRRDLMSESYNPQPSSPEEAALQAAEE